jgi:hypothetical protein
MIGDFITHFRFAQPGWLLLFIPSLLLLLLRLLCLLLTLFLLACSLSSLATAWCRPRATMWEALTHRAKTSMNVRE